MAPSFLFPPRSAHDTEQKRQKALLLCNVQDCGRLVPVEPSSQGQACAWIPHVCTTEHHTNRARAKKRIRILKPGRASLPSTPPLLCSHWAGWIPKFSVPAATHSTWASSCSHLFHTNQTTMGRTKPISGRAAQRAAKLTQPLRSLLIFPVPAQVQHKAGLISTFCNTKGLSAARVSAARKVTAIEVLHWPLLRTVP